MGHQRAIDRFPRVNEEVAGRTVDPALREGQHAHDLNSSTLLDLRQPERQSGRDVGGDPMTKLLRDRMIAGETLAGTFVKTPAHEVIEALAKTELDFVCLDAEHSAFDRGRMDLCLAMGKALGLPMLVRVPSGRPEIILGVLDSGAEGIVVPHVDSATKAEEISRSARYGKGGRGFAGGTRWAGGGGVPMAELLEKSKRETIVIAQIEEPEGVDAADEIAATPGIEGLFIGPNDLTVAYGATSPQDPVITSAFETCRSACEAHGKALVTWVPGPEAAEARKAQGVSMFFIGGELGFMQESASAAASRVKGL